MDPSNHLSEIFSIFTYIGVIVINVRKTFFPIPTVINAFTFEGFLLLLEKSLKPSYLKEEHTKKNNGQTPALSMEKMGLLLVPLVHNFVRLQSSVTCTFNRLPKSSQKTK